MLVTRVCCRAPLTVGYFRLGGTGNYAVDRIAADQTEEMLPGTKAMARNNRRYMERVVRHLAQDCGIRQFIDNGSLADTKQRAPHRLATLGC